MFYSKQVVRMQQTRHSSYKKSTTTTRRRNRNIWPGLRPSGPWPTNKTSLPPVRRGSRPPRSWREPKKIRRRLIQVSFPRWLPLVRKWTENVLTQAFIAMKSFALSHEDDDGGDGVRSFVVVVEVWFHSTFCISHDGPRRSRRELTNARRTTDFHE